MYCMYSTECLFTWGNQAPGFAKTPSRTKMSEVLNSDMFISSRSKEKKAQSAIIRSTNLTLNLVIIFFFEKKKEEQETKKTLVLCTVL